MSSNNYITFGIIGQRCTKAETTSPLMCVNIDLFQLFQLTITQSAQLCMWYFVFFLFFFVCVLPAGETHRLQCGEIDY